MSQKRSMTSRIGFTFLSFFLTGFLYSSTSSALTCYSAINLDFESSSLKTPFISTVYYHYTNALPLKSRLRRVGAAIYPHDTMTHQNEQYAKFKAILGLALLVPSKFGLNSHELPNFKLELNLLLEDHSLKPSPRLVSFMRDLLNPEIISMLANMSVLERELSVLAEYNNGKQVDLSRSIVHDDIRSILSNYGATGNLTREQKIKLAHSLGPAFEKKAARWPQVIRFKPLNDFEPLIYQPKEFYLKILNGSDEMALPIIDQAMVRFGIPNSQEQISGALSGQEVSTGFAIPKVSFSGTNGDSQAKVFFYLKTLPKKANDQKYFQFFTYTLVVKLPNGRVMQIQNAGKTSIPHSAIEIRQDSVKLASTKEGLPVLKVEFTVRTAPETTRQAFHTFEISQDERDSLFEF